MDQNNQEIASTATFPIVAFKPKELTWTISFFVAAVLFPALMAHSPQNQWIVGTIVNAIIFLAVWRVGVINAAFVAALPSSVALMRGLLPAPMAILTPWIIISNFVLIVIFFAARKHPLAGIFFASISKFLFLFAVSSFFFKLGEPLLLMMQWPQLFTALAGGLAAIGLVKLHNYRISFKN